MSADLPHTLYYKTDKNGKVIKPVVNTEGEEDEAVRLNNALMENLKRKKGVTVEELFDEAKNDNK